MSPTPEPRKTSTVQFKMVELKRIPSILRDGTEPVTTTSEDVHFLKGYKINTLATYNAGINKFLKYLESVNVTSFVLPATPDDIFGFCYWAGRVEGEPTDHDVSAATVAKYLYGLQMWHLYHRRQYPFSETDARVTILLRSSAHTDATFSPRRKKGAIQLQHLVLLASILVNGDRFQRTLFDLVLVAFWGMARLSELTYDSATGGIHPAASLLTTDVTFEEEGLKTIATIGIQGAKTARPGITQNLEVQSLPLMLCPIEALKRRITESKGWRTSLFGYFDHEGNRHHLTKPAVCRALTAIWTEHGHTGLSGHSFRVGGASFRYAVDTPIHVIQSLGRWTSDCYKLYLRDYSPEDKIAAVDLWAELESCWSNA
ncbi:hypothetical protein PSTG_05565 [Puccinia striiformis f. sp. tritici PST-78]|uniref:Tyr recombinase domain-containing protein n=1 Tax=Puccinia striiformis f. sp. tritici PST-78 TaxID=1165861 RepID=A0A0L0VPK6_9BASI|nr:hypothetical protein PSTG_05565 [Puccinia striiformis f. sp. tritici PST-78]